MARFVLVAFLMCGGAHATPALGDLVVEFSNCEVAVNNLYGSPYSLNCETLGSLGRPAADGGRYAEDCRGPVNLVSGSADRPEKECSPPT